MPQNCTFILKEASYPYGFDASLYLLLYFLLIFHLQNPLTVNGQRILQVHFFRDSAALQPVSQKQILCGMILAS